MGVLDTKIIFSNIDVFLDSLGLKPPIDEYLRDLPTLSLDEKNRLYGCDDESRYVLIRDNKKYYFNTFSSLDIETRDKDHIKNKDYTTNELILKTLEIAGYPTMVDSKFIFGTSDDELMFLVEFYKDGKRYIINLEYDLIMEKDKYYELKSFREITVLDKSQIYFLSIVFPKLKTLIPLIYFIIFYDEMMPILTKYEDFKLEGYDKFGINYMNHFLFMYGCDSMFKHCLKEYPIHDFGEVNELTLDSDDADEKTREDGKIVYQDYVFEKFSDYVIDEGKKKFLNTTNRFGLCHSAAKWLLLMLYHGKLAKNKTSNAKLVNGIVFYKGKYMIYHSWVEFMYKGVLMVADLTQNLFMEKEMYYRYTNAKVISVVDGESMDILDKYVKGLDITLVARIIDFFTPELIEDFKKNEKVLMI